jgi:hypothetical protein
MARYMEKERAESAKRSREHLAKCRAYQHYEKEMTKIQRRMHNEHGKAMNELRAQTAAGNKEHVAKHRAYEKTIGYEF